MNIGVILPGFSAAEADWAIPVQVYLLREMARQHNVRVIALRYPHRRDCYPVFGVQVHSLGVGHWVRGWGRLRLWWDALRLLRQLHRQRPFDVLHAMWADECGLLAAWAGRWLGVPVVVSVAGGELVGLDDIGYGLQRSAFSRWVVRQALYGAGRIVVYCSYTRHLLSTAGYILPEERLRTISLGVDVDVFRPGSAPRDPRRLLNVASLIPVKDQATLLRALARLPEDVSLDIVGEGPQRARLVELAEALGIARRVRFVGAVEHLAMPPFYRQAALHVLSSRHEALSMALLEAAASGLPTVGTAVGLLPDQPAMGVAVPVGDDPALAEAIRDLLNAHAQRRALGRAAVWAVREGFTVGHTVSRFSALYEELCRARSGL